MLPRHGFMEINAGTVLHLFPGEIHINVQRAPGGMTQSQGRDQYLASGEDDAGCNDDVADGPLLVIEIEIAGPIRYLCRLLRSCTRLCLLSFADASLSRSPPNISRLFGPDHSTLRRIDERARDGRMA